MTDVLAARTPRLAEDGYEVVLDALSADQVHHLSAAVDRVHQRHAEHVSGARAKSVQYFGAPAVDPEFMEPLALPAVLRIVCTALGWNIYLYHSHVDVNAPLSSDEMFSYKWHRDMQGVTYCLTPPLPMLSLKVGFFLTDVLAPDRGGPRVIPGSHLGNRVVRPVDPMLEPPDAVAVLAPAGSALIIDPRLWHSRGPNRSGVTRKVLYYAYAYRWIRPYDLVELGEERLTALSPMQRQLLGVGTSVEGFHLPEDTDVPLRDFVENGYR